MLVKLDKDTRKELEALVEKRGIGRFNRHFMLCVGDSCCDSEEAGQRSWKHLKSRLSALGLNDKVYRTKVGCLRICTAGPIGVVYPEGVWYRHLTPEAIDRVIQEQLIDGKPVEELVFARSPLPS